MDKGSKRDFQVSVWSHDHLTFILLLFKHSDSQNVTKTRVYVTKVRLIYLFTCKIRYFAFKIAAGVPH